MQQELINFLQEPKNEQKAVFEATAGKIGSVAFNIEKDFWVCLMLDMLFNDLPDSHPELMFKGGTSLSKIYGHINRFSEDIDIVVRRSNLGFDDNPVKLSNKSRKKFVEDLIYKCSKYVTESLRYELESQIKKIFSTLGISTQEFSITMDDEDKDNQTILFKYPTLYPAKGDNSYIKRMVKIECGARSALDPQLKHPTKPYISTVLPNSNLEITGINVISDLRTFWDKALIIHGTNYGFYGEGRLPQGDEHRTSRHFYDLAIMAYSDFKEKAISNISLLEEIKEHNEKVNFYSRWQRPDLAKPGTFKLVPYNELKTLMLNDYNKMSDMIFGDAPPFDFILDNLLELENDLNKI